MGGLGQEGICDDGPYVSKILVLEKSEHCLSRHLSQTPVEPSRIISFSIISSHILSPSAHHAHINSYVALQSTWTAYSKFRIYWASGFRH